MKGLSPEEQYQFNQNRYELLQQLDESLNLPMAILGFVWLGLLVIDLIRGLNSSLDTLFITIWVIFIFDFALKFFLAPDKKEFLKKNWLTTIALFVPAFRVFRALVVLRFARSVALTRIVSSTNRSMKALRFTMGRRGFGYVIALASLVALVGSAGIYAFENGINPDIKNFGSALWFTSIAITIGSDYWPYTPEGRVLAFMLGLFSFAVTGYVTATLASYFVGRDAESDDVDIANKRTIEDLKVEVQALRADYQTLRDEIRSLLEVLRVDQER